MKKNILYILCLLMTGSALTGCDEWLGDTTPSDFLTDDQVWNDNTMVTGVLANLYNDVYMNGSMDNDVNYSLFDDVMWCGLMNQDVETARNQMVAYPYDSLRYYNYEYIYKIDRKSVV